MAANEIPPLSSRLLAISTVIQQKRTDDLAAKGLSEGHDNYVLAIHRNPGIVMGDLAALLGISPSSTTKIAIKLEERSLLRREASRIDSRQNHAFLTDAGVDLANEIALGHAEFDAQLAGRLKAKDLDRLLPILDRLEGRGEPVGKKPRKAGKKKVSKAKKKGKKQKKAK